MGALFSLPPLLLASAAAGIAVAAIGLICEAECVAMGGLGWTFASLNAMLMRAINRRANPSHPLLFRAAANGIRFLVILALLVAAGLALHEKHFLSLALPFIAGFFTLLYFEIADLLA